jgi:hypothetical protein
MWRRVDMVLTDVSEECVSSIFRVEEKTRAHAGFSLVNFLLFSSVLKIEAIYSSETSVYTISTRLHIPGDGIIFVNYEPITYV